MKTEAGAIAIQQALVQELGYSYRQTANITGVNHRSVSLHVAAYFRGGKCTGWQFRNKVQQVDAIQKAKEAVKEYEKQIGQNIEPRGQLKGITF